ncbi:MAG: hypothetical protein GX663_08230 [Clostridiales bacterium]|nr:hypothetical protein [Clostridiales bacterium]
MKESIISNLFRMPLSRAELVVLSGEEYDKKNNEMLKRQRALLNTLSKEQRALFDEYENSLIAITEVEEDENFRQGFALGIRVTAEAFLCSEVKG